MEPHPCMDHTRYQHSNGRQVDGQRNAFFITLPETGWLGCRLRAPWVSRGEKLVNGGLGVIIKRAWRVRKYRKWRYCYWHNGIYSNGGCGVHFIALEARWLGAYFRLDDGNFHLFINLFIFVGGKGGGGGQTFWRTETVKAFLWYSVDESCVVPYWCTCM